MITPLDIERKEFSRSMRGFNVDEVDTFLDEIIVDLQKLLDENQQLKAEVKTLNQEVAKYKRSENSMMNTIESAKKLMNDISESAEKRAEIIVKNAQLDADVIQRDAKDSVSKLLEEGERLRQKINRYRDKYRQLLEDELNELEGSSADLIASMENDFMPASMMEPNPKEKTDQNARAFRVQTQPQVQTTEAYAEPEAKQAGVSKETLVINERSLEEILKEDFGLEDTKVGKKAVKEDLTKTRIF